MGNIESSYGFVFKGLLKAVNPIKKRVKRTECEVHKFINNKAVEILTNDGLNEAGEYFKGMLNVLNSGVVWADQDFRSSNHFFSPSKGKGLYGFSNAKEECNSYYKCAIKNYNMGNIEMAIFYLGAACHLVQDVTVPQHANINLFNKHRKYELWVIKTYREHDNFIAYNGGIYLDSIDDFISMNAKKAIATYLKHLGDKNIFDMYYKITLVSLTTAQRTTAGLLYKFYRECLTK